MHDFQSKGKGSPLLVRGTTESCSGISVDFFFLSQFKFWITKSNSEKKKMKGKPRPNWRKGKMDEAFPKTNPKHGATNNH